MRILADSTVWVDYLRGTKSAGAMALGKAIGEHSVIVGDLVLAEVLRGVVDENMARLVKTNLDRFEFADLCGRDIALQAAANYRILRSKGTTIRGTVDLLIGTWCIENAVPLIHADRDFEGMEKFLGLRRWMG